jgi:hypothetical protein
MHRSDLLREDNRANTHGTKAVDCILTLLPADDGPAPAAAHYISEAIKGA